MFSHPDQTGLKFLACVGLDWLVLLPLVLLLSHNCLRSLIIFPDSSSAGVGYDDLLKKIYYLCPVSFQESKMSQSK